MKPCPCAAALRSAFLTVGRLDISIGMTSLGAACARIWSTARPQNRRLDHLRVLSRACSIPNDQRIQARRIAQTSRLLETRLDCWIDEGSLGVTPRRIAWPHAIHYRTPDAAALFDHQQRRDVCFLRSAYWKPPFWRGHTMDLLLIFGVPLAVGFAAGYYFRACISGRRRKLAELHSPWPIPPAGRR